MIITYDSRFQNGEKFAKSLGYKAQSVSEELNDKTVLITRNDGVGQIPETTIEFIKKNKDKILGVVVQGNKKNHPDSFNGAADKIEEQYHLPIIARMDGVDHPEDKETVLNFIKNL
ncbi:MAG: class Ib ribonucleoside-diphosphate reductase assembly flavoprotein NrdI [Bacilli bacterium]|jgi:protein involved in ribonucleotide reduction|nr:class Ib ribonucleoside-diphosphate reductase assembly flavoprotein NrdI [Bacilli bacterium]